MAKQENVNIKININTSNATRTIGDLRKRFKEVSEAMGDAIVAGDKVKQQDLASEYTKLSGEVKKVKSHLKALNPGALMEGFVNLASGAVGAMSAITGAFMIFGDENERIQELQQKSIALIQTMMGLHQARTLLISAEAKASMKAITQTIALRYKKISAQLKDTLTIEANTKATKVATAVQKLWNKAIAANPIVAIVAAVAALTAGIVSLVKHTKTQTSEMREQYKMYNEMANIKGSYLAKLEIEKRSMNSLFEEIKKTNAGTEERKILVDELNRKYKDYLPDLDLEKATLEELAIAQRKSNVELQNKIAIQAQDKAMGEIIDKITDLKIKEMEATQKLARAEKDRDDAMKTGSQNQLSYIQIYNKAKKELDAITFSLQAQEQQLKNIQDYFRELIQLDDADDDDDFGEEALKRYLGAIKKANEEAKLQIALGEDSNKVRLKEKEAIYSATKAYYELNGYTADEIEKLKELRAEIDKLNAEIASSTAAVDAIKDLERAELELRLKEAIFNKDHIKELELTKQIEELDYKERLAKYKKQLEDKIITKEQYDAIELLLEKNHKNNLAAIDEQYADDKAAVQERINEVTQSKMEKEISATEEKYRKLIEDAILYGFETKELEIALQEELKAIRERYAKGEVADEADLNRKKLDLEKSRYRELWRLRIENAKTIKEWQDAAIEASKLEEEAALETARLAYESELELYKDNEEKKIEITKSYEDLKTEITKKAEKDREEIRKESNQRSLDNAAALMGRMAEMTNAIMEAELEAAGDNEEKKKEIRKKYAVGEAMISIAQIAVDTASGMMKEIGKGGISGIIMAAVIAAIGAAQVAKVMVEVDKIKSMRRGGLIIGPSHENGGVLRELEGGEAVINKNSMALPGVPAMISAINQAGGGVPIGSPSVSKSGAAPAIAAKIDESALDAIVTKVTQSIAAIPVMVSEVDITETQRRVEVIESKTVFG